MHLFDYLDSGNGYKVRLLLAQLGQKYEWTEVDIDKGETRTPEFLKRNPERPHSDAATRRRHLPSRVQRHPLVPGRRLALRAGDASSAVRRCCSGCSSSSTATSRTWPRRATSAATFPADHPRRAELPDRLAKGRAAFAVMEQHLSTRQFFVNERYSIADIALYAYSHVAEDGGHDLEPYPNVREWLGRVAAQPSYVPLLAKPK